jgi:hypothetical protein
MKTLNKAFAPFRGRGKSRVAAKGEGAAREIVANLFPTPPSPNPLPLKGAGAL